MTVYNINNRETYMFFQRPSIPFRIATIIAVTIAARMRNIHFLNGSIGDSGRYQKGAKIADR
jgi:hypothetical protein